MDRPKWTTLSLSQILHEKSLRGVEREFFLDNLLVRIHLIILVIRWTGLAPWQFEFPFSGSLTSTFLDPQRKFSSRSGTHGIVTDNRSEIRRGLTVLHVPFSLGPGDGHFTLHYSNRHPPPGTAVGP